jgi:hypothetical protein
MGYLILAAVLLIIAVLRLGLLLRGGKESVYWYVQPFIFPAIFSISALMEYLDVIAITAYVAISGLLFELVSWIHKKRKGVSKS